MTKNQVAEMLSRSFGLDFGEAYGASFFRDMAILLLRGIVDLPEVTSFYKLAEYASKHPEFLLICPKRVKDDTTHLQATLDSLADIEPLNVSKEWCDDVVTAGAIDFADILETPQIVYFSLPSTLENRVSFTIAKLVTYLLLTAASMRSSKQKNKVFLCVDEFQRIVNGSPDFSIFVQQARAFEIGCILACQTVSDLETAGRSFTDILEENTITKISLTAMGREAVQRVIDRSPRTLTSSPDAGALPLLTDPTASVSRALVERKRCHQHVGATHAWYSTSRHPAWPDAVWWAPSTLPCQFPHHQRRVPSPRCDSLAQG